MLRLFIAAMPAPQAQAKIASLAHKVCARNGKIPPTDNFHLTLRFFGEVDNLALPKMIEGLDVAVSETRQIVLEPMCLLTMPEKRPRMLWLQIKPNDLLTELHQKLLETILPFTGADIKNLRRGVRPHFTVARGAQVVDSLKADEQQQLPKQLVLDRLRLLESPFPPKGDPYPCHHEARLASG